MSPPVVYPPGTVRALLDTPLVGGKTRQVLEARLAKPTVKSPAFLNSRAFATLRAACERLIPQTGADRVDVAGAIDARLAEKRGNGWRYEALPPDGEAYRRGLNGLDETARALCDVDFIRLDPAGQDRVLSAVQGGAPPGETWRTLSAVRWFEEMLVEATEVFYAHPLAQEEIGFVGMADAQGWSRIGLNEREPHEPSAGPDAPV